MRNGWDDNPRLRDLVQRSDPGAHLLAEVVTVGNASIKRTQTEWLASSTTGSIQFPISGGARLNDGTTAEITQATDDSTEVTNLSPLPTFDALLIEWTNANSVERELKNFVARLHPRPDNLQPKDVTEWRCQAFRAVYYGPDRNRLVVIPISKEVIVDAAGESAGDVTFNFFDGVDYPFVGRAPEFDPDWPGTPTTRSQTIIRILALDSEGAPADNVAWLANSALGSSIITAAGIVTHYGMREPETAAGEETGGSVWWTGGERANMPRFVINKATYAAGSVTFDGANAIPDLTGTGDLEVVASGRAPAGTTLEFKIWNGAAYVECKSGDLVGVDNSATGGEDLSGVPTTGPWDVEVDLTPDVSLQRTPWAREFGIQRVETTDLFGLATVSGGRSKIDPVSLKGNIPSAEITILKTGARDFRDYGTVILSENHIGDINVRLWIGEPSGVYLNRSEWMHHSTWEVEDYKNGDAGHVLKCYSPIRRLRTPIPEFVDTGGGSGTRTAIEYTNETPKDVWDDIVDGRVGLPGRLRGPGVTDEVNTISKTLDEVDAKDELDRVAYLVGYSNIESQGQIKAVQVMRDGVGGGTPVAFFPIGSYEPVSIGPGFDTRTDEFFVPLDWDEESGSFASEVRVFNATAFTKLGGAGLTTTQKLEAETAKWIITDVLGEEIARRVPQHFGNGLIVWEIKPIYLQPHLEVGDVVVIETNQFVARSPITDREIRGPVATLAIVVDNNANLWGRHLSLWVPGIDGIVESDGDIDWLHFKKPTIVTGQIVPQDDDSIRFQGTTAQAAAIRAADSGAAYPNAATVGAEALQATDAAGRFDFEIAPPGTYALAAPIFVSALAYEKVDGTGAVSPQLFEVNLVRESVLLTLSTVLLESVPQENSLVQYLQSFQVGPGVNSVQIVYVYWTGFPGALTDHGYTYPVDVEPGDLWSEPLRALESSAWDTIAESAGAQIKGAAAAGVSAITVDDAASLVGFVTHGDHLTFDSDPGQIYKIRKDATASSDEIALLISPDIQTPIADNDGVTIYNHPVLEVISDEAAHALAFTGTTLWAIGTDLGIEAGVPTPVIGELYKPQVDVAQTSGAGTTAANEAGLDEATKADAMEFGSTLRKLVLDSGRPHIGLHTDSKAFGAVGDGVELNLTPLQDASDAVLAEGSGVQTIGRGVYLVEGGDWEVDVGTNLIGESAGSTIIRATKTALYTGTASSGANLTITDVGAGRTVNVDAGKWLEITAGQGAGQIREVLSNTADTWTIHPYAEWSINPNATSVFKIYTPTRILLVGTHEWSHSIRDIMLDGCTLLNGPTGSDVVRGASMTRVEIRYAYKGIEFLNHAWLNKSIDVKVYNCCFGVFYNMTDGTEVGQAMELLGVDIFNCHDAIATYGVSADGFHLQVFGGSHEHNYHSSLRIIDGTTAVLVDYFATHQELNQPWAGSGKSCFIVDNDGGYVNVNGLRAFPAGGTMTAMFQLDGGGRTYLRGPYRISWDEFKIVHFAGAGYLILDSDQGLSNSTFFGTAALRIATATSSASGKIINGGMLTGDGGGAKTLAIQNDTIQELPAAAATWEPTRINPHIASCVELLFDFHVTNIIAGVGLNNFSIFLNPGGVTVLTFVLPTTPTGNPFGHGRIIYTPLGRMFVALDYDDNHYHAFVADPHAITVQKFISLASTGANPSTILIESLSETIRC